MRLLVCPGPLSDGIGPALAAELIRDGWRTRSADEVDTLAMSDGASGVIDVVHGALGAQIVAVTVPGPLGAPTPATLAHVPAGPGGGRGTVVVDAGQVIGPQLVAAEDRPAAAWAGSSEGLGALLSAALDRAPGRVVVALGVAATHDAGAGLLRGLGLTGPRLAGGAAGLDASAGSDLDGIEALRDRLAGIELVVACAVDEPLAGLSGAGAALCRRAGLDPGRAQAAEAAASHFAALVAGRAPGRRILPLALGDGAAAPRGSAAVRPMTGAGGGCALVLEALGARLADGADVVAGLIGLEARARSADLLVTGCASLDADAVHAGVVARVGAIGLRRGIPVVVIAGEVPASRRELARIGVVGGYALRPALGPFAPAAQGPPSDEARLLRERAARVAATWSGA